MPVALAAAAAATLAAASPAPAAPPAADTLAWRPDVRSARAFARERRGSVSFAVSSTSHLYAYRGRRLARSASVVKAMLLVSYLDHRRVRGRELRGSERSLLRAMITRSDNRAASRVRGYVGNGSLEALARRAGMRHFRAAPSWGDTQTTALDQARLFLHIDGRVVRRHRKFAMRLLRSVVREQRWGVARVRPPGWALHFKGGWDDDPGGADHQAALLRRGRRRVAVAILTTANPSHEYGKRTLRGVARRLLHGLDAAAVPASLYRPR